MKIKNKDLQGFVDFLMQLSLKGKQSRMRTKFCRELGKCYQEFEQYRGQLIEEYGELDEKGNVKTEIKKIKVRNKDGEIEEKEYEVYMLKDAQEYQKEYSILLEEESHIEQNEGNKEMLLAIQDMVLNCDLEFSGEKALEYDLYCDYVETISYD